MFTGLIEEIGVVSRRSGAELAILAKTVMDGIALGDSIAVDGVCLTVAAINEDSFVVQVSQETFARSTMGRLQAGHAVNLERAMAAGARFGGHFVLGHVDGVGRVHSVREQGDFALWIFQAPAEVAQYLTPKGSIAVDGISLTVVEPHADTFSVALIPTTLAKTTLKNKRPGDPVNMEADMIGKHIVHHLKHMTRTGAITKEFLSQHGFT
jgi:riboflavin synthase